MTMLWSAAGRRVALQEADERKFITDNVASIKRATGVAPTGYNGAAMRGTINTLKILQEEGFNYHIDDVSRDEPFVIPVRGKDLSIHPASAPLDQSDQASAGRCPKISPGACPFRKRVP
ncbi:polysaccharide deacetylase [Pseudorhizobium halotolerans]|uniref:Polysaccharide deacetylase n=1 Tax=Pseudorhizobium halotolerans TaxID=1233081 RepID=A0ABM8PX66_9HYPH|nr:hypothetical protein [Pseudorhizobium halotolerans]CAD7053378.1 polysaccharide deacetylase [Pseudorhizobium halotolerans]